MAYQKVTQRQIDFIEKVVLRRSNLAAMRVLLKCDMTHNDMHKIHPYLKLDKFVYILGIVRKYKDDNGVVKFGLTKLGRALAQSVDTFLTEINNLLPPGE